MSTSVSIDFLTLPLPDGVEAPSLGSIGTGTATDPAAAGIASVGAELASSTSITAPQPSAIQMELNSTEDEDEDDDDEDEDDDDVPGAGATAQGANGEEILLIIGDFYSPFQYIAR